jgi:hypothetical protein
MNVDQASRCCSGVPAFMIPRTRSAISRAGESGPRSRRALRRTRRRFVGLHFFGHRWASARVDLVHEAPQVLVARGERISGTLEAAVKLAEHDAGVEVTHLGQLPFERGDEVVPTRELLALRFGTDQLRRMGVEAEVTPPT